MATFGEAISSIIIKIAQYLGIKPSDRRRIDMMEQKLATAKAHNVSKIESLKEKIGQLESHAVRKKKEYEKAIGDRKRIIGGEIERLIRDLDRLQGQENIISSNIERISIAQGKLEEVGAADFKGLDEGELDDIALELQESFDELRGVDQLSGELERISYKNSDFRPVNAEKRMAEVEGEQVTTSGLSLEAEKRLQQLEIEDE